MDFYVLNILDSKKMGVKAESGFVTLEFRIHGPRITRITRIFFLSSTIRNTRMSIIIAAQYLLTW